jgi:hypothetical protein
MGVTRQLLILSLAFVLGHCLKAPALLEAPMDCLNLNYTAQDFKDTVFSQTNRTGNLDRFCQIEAYTIRREHFWCRGYIDENNTVVEGTTRVEFPDPDVTGNFWTVFLQYPALSWMDVARKASVLRIIQAIVTSQRECATNVMPYREFCVADVSTYDVAQYTESVLIRLYNLGSVSSGTFDSCFTAGLRDDTNKDLVVQFRGKRALNLTLEEEELLDMFNRNIGPASSIGDEGRDPTLRPIVLRSWPGYISLSDARRMTSDGAFGSNPNPINYGLEAGDIVFAVFGSILLVVVGALVLLGFFIHPFFLS